MRTEIEELVVMIECKTQLQIAGDTYSLSAAINTQAELISAQNKKATAKLLEVPGV